MTVVVIVIKHLFHLFIEEKGPGLIRPTRKPETTTPFDPSAFPTAGPNKMLVFDGESWITYDFSQLPDEYLNKNQFEKFHIRFKSEEPNGLLWYSGTDQRNMHLSLKVRN